jgi:acetyl-CoA acetyltransferase
MASVFIVGAKRTPFGAFGGKLSRFSATDVGLHATKAALAASGVAPAEVDRRDFRHGGPRPRPTPRTCRATFGLKAGARVGATALGVNRLCGSGFQAVVCAAHEIRGGESRVVVAGGAESVSQAWVGWGEGRGRGEGGGGWRGADGQAAGGADGCSCTSLLLPTRRSFSHPVGRPRYPFPTDR